MPKPSPRFVSGAFGGTIVRNKPLTLGAVAALLAAGGNANGAVCPTSSPVMTIESSGFSCTLGDKSFSSFFLLGVPTTATVSFGINGQDFAVTLARGGTFFTTQLDGPADRTFGLIEAVKCREITREHQFPRSGSVAIACRVSSIAGSTSPRAARRTPSPNLA